MKIKDPYARKGIAPWKAWLISLSSLAVVLVVLWVFNLFAWAGMKSPLDRYDEPVPVEEPVNCGCSAQTDSSAVVMTHAE